jgi:hypothetical protein
MDLPVFWMDFYLTSGWILPEFWFDFTGVPDGFYLSTGLILTMFWMNFLNIRKVWEYEKGNQRL